MGYATEHPETSVVQAQLPGGRSSSFQSVLQQFVIADMGLPPSAIGQMCELRVAEKKASRFFADATLLMS
jgi:hypothetical protein